jgi:TonB-linked SusC/RagA family outer membrane protein
MRLEDIFMQIESETKYRFAYNKTDIDVDKVYTINIQEAEIKDVLNQLFSDKKISYSVIDRQIVLAKPERAFTISQQSLTVSGKVTDSSGIPLPGVTVIVKGTTTGTITDADGSYSLSSIPANATLQFSFVGMKTQEIAVGNKTTINVSLVEETIGLEEVVAVGYGVQKKVNLTGAIASVTSDEIVKRQVGQSSMVLQGIAPGVTVTQRSGQPGKDGGNIRIRGIGTLNDSNPLILVDGIEMGMNNVDVNLIESISILKDAASSAIYGSRAANGVILITTKRAKAGQFTLGYHTYIGIQTPTDLTDPVNAVDHMKYMDIANTNVGKSPVFGEAYINEYIANGPSNRDKYPDTDWQDEIYTGSGIQQSHFLTLSAGTEKIRVLAALGYYDQKGIIENTNYRRYTARFNADMQVLKRLNAKFDIFTRYINTKEPSAGIDTDGSGVLYWLNRMPANQVSRLSNGKWGTGWEGDNPTAKMLDGGIRNERTPQLVMNMSLNYQVTDWLRAEVSFAPSYTPSMTTTFSKPIETYRADGSLAFTKPPIANLSEDRNTTFNQDYKALLTADKTFGKHTIKALAGFSQEQYWNNWINGTRINYPFLDYPVLNAGGTTDQKATGSGSEWVLRSFFGRVNYDFNARYLFEANLRYDGSSRFAKGKKYGLFPSFSMGWRISEEEFMTSLRNAITNLKLRASWGQLGNQLIGGNYPFASFINYNTYVFGGTAVSGASIDDMANPDISWEKTEMTNIGVDFDLWSKFSGSFDYYVRNTSGILLPLDIPRTTGLTAPYQNAGEVRNKGWDLGLNYKNNDHQFKYEIGFVLSDVKNKVLDLKGISRTGLTVSNEGYPINSIYGLEADGYITDADYDQSGNYLHATQYGNFGRGDIKYKDQPTVDLDGDGKPDAGDGVINNKDEVIIGSTIPRFTYSFNINLNYKNFDLAMFWQGVGKADGYLGNNATMPFYLGGTIQEQNKDYWTPDNPDAKFPRLAFNEPNNEKNSSFWMKDASYLRLKNIQVGYSLPKSLIDKVSIQKLRIYVSGQNLLTFDRFWDGYDVESPVGVGNHYPQVKLFTMGLDVKF